MAKATTTTRSTTRTTGATTSTKPAAKPAAAPTGSTTSKPTAAELRAKAADAAQSPELKVVEDVTPESADEEMKKKDLIDLVVSRSGMKKKDVKPVVEATMAILGEALAAGRELNLQPLGKVRINRTKVVNGANVITARIRQSEATVVGQDAAADANSDDTTLAEDHD